MGVSRRTASVELRPEKEVSTWCSSCLSLSARQREDGRRHYLELGLDVGLYYVYAATNSLQCFYLLVRDVSYRCILSCKYRVLFE